jgi:translation initiation factor IF-2
MALAIAGTASSAAGLVAVNAGLIGSHDAGAGPVGKLDARLAAELDTTTTRDPRVVVRTLPPEPPQVTVIYQDEPAAAAPARPAVDGASAPPRSGGEADAPVAPIAPAATPSHGSTVAAATPVAPAPRPSVPTTTVTHTGASPVSVDDDHDEHEDDDHEAPEIHDDGEHDDD